MLKDWNHDLVQQLSETSDSAWRMKEYMKNSKGCEHYSLIWKNLEKDYEQHVKFLTSEITRHVKENRFE